MFVEDCVDVDNVIEKCGDADAVLLDMAPMTRAAIAGYSVEEVEKLKGGDSYGRVQR